MFAYLRIIVLFGALCVAQSSSANDTWQGTISDGRVLVIVFAKSAVISVSTRISVTCAAGIEAGTKEFTGHGAPIRNNQVNFQGTATTVCGNFRVRLEGQITGTTASGSLVTMPPSAADNPAQQRLTWKANKTEDQK